MIIGHLTTRWNCVRMATLFSENIQKNTSLMSTDALQFRYGEILPKPVYDLTDDLKDTYRKYKIVRPNDIILNGLNLNYDFVTQRVALVKTNGIITSAYICLRPREGVSARYYTYLLKTLDSMKALNGMGTGIRLTLSYNLLKNLDLPIPSCDEQNQIARYLDWKVSEINKLIVAKKKQISLLLEQRGALIDKAILHGIRECPQKDSGVYWLGNVPETWTISPIKRICQVNASTTHIAKGKDSAEMVTFLPMENVSVTGAVDCSIKKPISEVCSGFSSFARNDVVVAKITPCFENGKGACLDELDTEIGYGTTEFINLRASEKVLPKYLYMITMTRPFRKLGEKVMTGSAGQKRIPVSFIKNFSLGVPSTNEQEEILQWLNDMLLAIDKMIVAEKQYIDILHELRTRLIYDVVTGQIDVRNIAIPDFELVDEIDADEESPDEEVEPSEVNEQ